MKRKSAWRSWPSATGAALLALLSGCFSGHATTPQTTGAPTCAPQQRPVSTSTLLRGARGWAFGTRPVYVSFLVTPMYRGGSTFVAIYRDRERNGQYGVKLMTIIHPTSAGEISQHIAAITPGRKAAFSEGGSSLAIDRLLPTRELKVRRGEELVPGGLRVTGPGCYRLTLEARGRRYEFAFPVRFGRAD